MAIGVSSSVLWFIRHLAGAPAGAEQSDRELLRQFLAHRDELAFTTLLQRHGPLVLGVCRQILGDSHDAEDVFQATFLVLARKAGSVRRQQSLRAWIYRVACNLAVEARRAASRRRLHERRGVSMRMTDAMTETENRDWQPVLHEEVNRLPAKYRVPVVLCYLEGKTSEEAARQLRCPVGTVKGRLGRARDLLRLRLTRRGLTLSAVALAANFAQQPLNAAVPVGLQTATLEAALLYAAGKAAAAGVASAKAVHLATVLVRTMTMIRILLFGLVLFVAGLAGTGSMLAFQALGGRNDSLPTNPDAGPPAFAGAVNLPPASQFSEWGAEQAGLRCRVEVPSEIEQGVPLKADVHFKADLNKLPPNVKQLNTFLPAAYFKLNLVHKPSGKTFQVTPYDPTLGMPVGDSGKYAVVLNGTEIKPLKVSFPLVKLGTELQPGVYECRTHFAFPPQPKWWQGTPAELKAAGFWSGAVESAPFSLTILKEIPKTQIAWLPKQLRLTKGLAVTYGKDDAEKVTLTLRNGYVVGTMITRDGGSYSLQGGFPTPDAKNPIDEWSSYKEGPKKATYTIEVFETADPPEHHWHPGPGSGGYKVLWKKSFTLSYTEEEIKKIKAGLFADPAAPKKNAEKNMAASKPVRSNQVDFQAVVEPKCSAPPQGGKQALDLGLRITNRHEKPLWFNLYDTAQPNLKSADGKIFAYELFRLRTAPAKPIHLGPGQEHTVLRSAHLEWRKVGKALSLRLSGPDGSGGTWHFKGLLPGKYRLFYTYENTAKATAGILNHFKEIQFGADSFWLGTAKTEEVEFEILLQENPKQDAGVVPLEKLIADLKSNDGQVRVIATKQLFERGQEASDALKKAGAKQVAPFGGTVDGTWRMDMVYSLLEGLPPSPPKPAGGYLPDTFGLHVAKGTTKKEIVAMGTKHGFVLSTEFNSDSRPNCYVKIAPGKSLAKVMQAVLIHEPKIVTLNLNYYEAGKAATLGKSAG